jgi:hypothetical protein
MISKSIAAARKWAPEEVEKIDAETLMEVAEAARKRETIDFEVNVPVVVECLGDPRVIDTQQGPWDVIDVATPDGTEHLISLGRTVLKKKIAEQMPCTGKKLVIMALGKPTGKKYYDYTVMPLDAYKALAAKKKVK